MTKDPWTDPDPQPGDFDRELDRATPDQIEVREGNPDAKLKIVINVEGDDAQRLARIARARGEGPDQVIAELLRAADSRS
jgi:hypothetical protein